MSSMGFVARMANWLRGDVEQAERSPFERDAAEEDARAVAVVEAEPPAPEDAARQEAVRRQQAVLADMAVRFTRATDALEAIRGNLSKLEGTFEELPEAVRAQTRFLAAIHERLEVHEVHLAELTTVLRELPEASLHQSRTLEKTNSLLEESRASMGPLTGGFHRLANTMQGLNESSERHLMCLGLLTERHERYLREQRDAFRRHNRMVVVALAVVGLVGLGAVAVGLLALLG
jgi:chromosome segregation ATPase